MQVTTSSGKQGRGARILKWALLDLLGILLLALGAAFLARDVSLLGAFPGTTSEALACVVLGLVLMAFAGANLLRSLLKGNDPL